MALQLYEGCVVEYADKSKFHLGVVSHIDEKGGKVKVLTQTTGREINLASKQILHGFETRIPLTYPGSQISAELHSIDARASSRQAQCDIPELWSLLEDSEEIELHDLISLQFTEVGTAETLGMIRALRADRIYFKSLPSDRYLRRPAQTVETLQRQETLKAQKAQWRASFIDEAAKILAADVEDRQQWMEQVVLPHSEVRDAWELMESYALFGSECQEHAEAELLLGMLQDRLNRGFAGTAHIRARTFLKASGYWSKTESIPMLKYHIHQAFSSSCETQAHEIYCQKLPEDRLDLTHLEILSIDDSETLDIDDALSIERLADGRYRLGVHIAAPAAMIPLESDLEKEARQRATSVYLPECRVPMLPLILSENGLSLTPGQPRAALTYFMIFDAQFNLIESQIERSIVMSKHRLTYDAAEQLLEEGDDSLADALRLIQEICEISAANRRSHGAIEVDLPEYKLKYNEDDDSYTLIPIDGQMMSRQLVSECMIMANTTAAEFCYRNDIPILYRIQPQPIGMPTQKTLDEMPNDYMRAVSIRRCMQPAATSFQPERHAGLGVDMYTQVTSPLRRYADLLCDYQLECYLSENHIRWDAESFNAILSESGLGLSNARQASKEAYQTATLKYLSSLGDSPLQAMIVQYQNDRDLAQVMLLETQMRGTVSTRQRFSPGTLCYVKIDHINADSGTMILQFVDICT